MDLAGLIRYHHSLRGRPKPPVSGYRVVEYYGYSLVIPFDARWLSTDGDGWVTAHSENPWAEPDFYEGYEIGEIGQIKIPEGVSCMDMLKNIGPPNKTVRKARLRASRKG